MKQSILIVDDTALNRAYLKAVLKKFYTVYEASTGEDGYKIASEKQPDLILLDIMMPILDGFDTAKMLKCSASTTHIPIMFVTASCDPTHRLRAVQLGAVDVIIKPFTSAMLLSRIQAFL